MYPTIKLIDTIMKQLAPLFTILLIASLMTSCVSKKKYEEAMAAAAAEKAALEKSLDEERAAKEKLQGELATLESNLNMSKAEIEKLSQEIKANNAKIASLRTSITDVFKDYDNSELNVREEGGKLYISVSNKILFRPGRDKLEGESQETIEKLAGVFNAASASSLNIMVEGHTDSDPVKIHKYKFKDNWSLSAARATNVVRALQEAGVKAGRLTASGKGDTQPVAANDNDEGKEKNRRTEFIAYPNARISALYNKAKEIKAGGDTN